MRGIDTDVKKIRRYVFTEIAKVGFESTDESLISDIESIPFHIVQERPMYRDNIYQERAIVSERVRLAMGMSLRPSNRVVHVTEGIEASNIDESYYEPPLMQVIPSACDACEDNKYEVTNMCRGCLAHPCVEVCPVGAVSLIKGRSVIDQDKCIKCGKCKAACPYDAITKKERPCIKACGVNAIISDTQGRAVIDNDICVSCGMCMVNCPFGAISDKSQIFQLAHAIKEHSDVVAIVAPAYIGQFGPKVTPNMFVGALKALGFSHVYEVALGADIGAISEAHQYAQKVATKELPFLLTSCCPSWSMLAKNQFPDLAESVSEELTPMVATARKVKQERPEAKVVFIGPCAAKKLEASRQTIRSDVDFVITFEELTGMFNAKNIDPLSFKDESSLHDATGAGRGYASAGGVAQAIEDCVHEYYPDVDVKVAHAEGLAECKKTLLLAKAGRLDGYMIEGMGCPGGCLAGAGTNIDINTAKRALAKHVSSSSTRLPAKDLENIVLD